MLQTQQDKTLLKAIKQVRAVYMKRGFRVKNILLDGQFECLHGELSTLGITVNVVSNDEHVPDIERYIRTVKERTRCVHNTLPFCKMLPRLIIEMVYASVFWLNCFPVENGVSSTHSPRDLIVGLPIDYNKHCQVEFGTYVQVHEEHDNLMVTRTTGAITLRPTGNVQGGYYFFSLTTGRHLNWNRWTVLPMPGDVITRVHNLARRSRAALGLEFTDRHGEPYPDDNGLSDDPDSDDDTYDPADDDTSDDGDDDDDSDDDRSAASDTDDSNYDEEGDDDDDDDADDNYHNFPAITGVDEGQNDQNDQDDPDADNNDAPIDGNGADGHDGMDEDEHGSEVEGQDIDDPDMEPAL